MTRSENIRGAATMAAAMCAYTFNDVWMKLLSGTMPLGQAVFLRGIGTVLLLLALCLALGQLRLNFSAKDWRRILIRSGFETAAAFFFLNAVFNMPISNATAIMQSLPLTVALAAALVLRERIGWRRILAIIVGFIGVLMIVRPGSEGFNAYSLSALMAVASVTVRDIVVRAISPEVPATTMALVAATAVTAAFGIYSALFDSWVPVSGDNALALVIATVSIVGGYVLSVSAMRWGDIGFVAPFRYTALIMGIVFGLTIFGERPTLLTYAGAALIMATGIFTILRETRTR